MGTLGNYAMAFSTRNGTPPGKIDIACVKQIIYIINVSWFCSADHGAELLDQDFFQAVGGEISSNRVAVRRVDYFCFDGKDQRLCKSEI